jgi:hypothetical protein
MKWRPMDELETMALLIRRTSLGRLKGWGKRGEMREGEMDEDSEGMGGEVEEKGEGVEGYYNLLTLEAETGR